MHVNIDRQAVLDAVRALGSDKEAFLSNLEKSIAASIQGKRLSECLTIVERMPSGKLGVSYVPNPPDIEYAKALIKFCRGSTFNGMSLDSSLTDGRL